MAGYRRGKREKGGNEPGKRRERERPKQARRRGSVWEVEPVEDEGCGGLERVPHLSSLRRR
ncbi:hypothetical protein [Thermosporothrix hazakensis]|nr:hypothetical protein [Thermosporothrix hazakensis]GCE45146.1 hypothetical protein KTH_00150 [Thermosporothrix hazakensis]